MSDDADQHPTTASVGHTPFTYRELLTAVLPRLAPDSLDREVRVVLPSGDVVRVALICTQGGLGPVFMADERDAKKLLSGERLRG